MSQDPRYKEIPWSWFSYPAVMSLMAAYSKLSRDARIPWHSIKERAWKFGVVGM